MTIDLQRRDVDCIEAYYDRRHDSFRIEIGCVSVFVSPEVAALIPRLIRAALEDENVLYDIWATDKTPKVENVQERARRANAAIEAAKATS